MRVSTVKPFLASLIVVTTLCGCSSLPKPSDRTRHDSYAKVKELFVADQEAALRQTYVVFSGDSKLKTVTFKSDAGSKDAILSFTNSLSTLLGLAIALDKDGYLLTAGHVAGNTNDCVCVLGWFDGRIEFRPARVVFRNNLKLPADVALLKVDGKLDHCVTFGDEPKVSDPVAAVACYYNLKNTVMGGNVDFTGGRVIRVSSGPRGSSLILVVADLPAWHGDSGGPLLSSTGQLIGVVTQGNFRKYQATCFLPNKEFIQNIIERDRASIKAANTALEPTPTAP